jgi:inner membrane protein
VTLGVTANLPDVDALALLLGDEGILLRRGLTHSIAMAPVLAAGAAWVIRRFYPNQSWRGLFLLAAIGIASHLFFDLVNSFGVVLLYPFDSTRFELACVYIVDVVLLAILLAPLLVSRFASKWTRIEPWSIGAVAAAGVYVLAALLARTRAAHLLEEVERPPPDFRYVFPEALGPHRFRGVVRRGDEYRLYRVNVLTGESALVETVRTESESPLVRRARETPRGRRLEWFFKAPVWRAVSADEVEVYDLRFRSTVRTSRLPFVYRIRVP